jgi:SAM-dependent methyltransferase|tara:strand:+ start:2169 stop:2993 length:825 start_codon:yes stop_codon:yes gene_type:complete
MDKFGAILITNNLYLRDKKALAYFEGEATPEFWDRHWDYEGLREYILSCASDGIFIPFVKKHLPLGSKVLEGGCGRGQIVHALSYHGYKAVGIDFAVKTVHAVNRAVPELDIRIGDVRRLPFEDGELDGYISSGVIEHFWNGYEEILSEMARTIRKKGYLFISFPFMSLLRKVKNVLGMYPEAESSKLAKLENQFYQFAFESSGVIRDLEEVGFKLISKRGIGGLKGLKDETKLFSSLLQRIYNGEFSSKLCTFFQLSLRPFSAHMLGLVMKRS